MIISSFEEELRFAPANSSSIRTNPFGPISYGWPIPANFGGFGAIVENKGRAGYQYTMDDPPGVASGGVSGLGDVASSILGTVNPAGAALSIVGAGLSIAQMIGQFLIPSVTGMQKQDATTIVNGKEVELKQVLAALQANPTCDNKTAAVGYFYTVWDQIISACSQLAGPGTACVNDRAPGGKFDWWKAYLAPMQAIQCSTPAVATNTGIMASSGTQANTLPSILSSMFSGLNSTTVLIGAAVLLLLMMGKE